MILVASLIIGGSSVAGLPTTFAVQLAALPLLALIASRSRWYDASVLALVAATLLLFVLHLLPLGGLLGSYGGEAMSISGDWIRTLDALLFFLAATAFFLVVGTLGENGLNRLVAFLLIGLVLNVALALVQFAASSPVLVGFLPYSTSAGFFANQNHFASLVFVGIPFVIYQFVALRRPLLSLVAVAVLVRCRVRDALGCRCLPVDRRSGRLLCSRREPEAGVPGVAAGQRRHRRRGPRLQSGQRAGAQSR